MKKAIIGMMLALLCSVSIASENNAIYSQDFSSGKEENYKLLNGSKIEDGKLICTQGRFELFFTADSPIKISFKVRELEIFAGADHHWGFHLKGGDNYSAHVYTRGTAVISALTRNKGKVDTKLGGKSVTVSRGADKPWSTVDIYIGKKTFGVSINNESCIVQDVSLLPLKSMGFYAYRVKFEIDDVKVTKLKEKQINLIEKPVFSASFDNTLDAKDANDKTISPTMAQGYRFLPGVSGMGFSCKQKMSPIGVKYAKNQWKVTAKNDFLGEKGGIVSILVPNLKDFDFEAKFQRLGNVKNADHHFNFSIASAGKTAYGFHIRDNNWMYRNSKKGEKNKSFKAENKVKNNLDEKPILFKLVRKDGKLTLSLDGKIHEFPNAKFNDVSGFNFYGYGVKYKLDDIKVSGGKFKLKEDFSKKPVLYTPGVDYALEKPFNDKVGGVSFWIKSNNGKGLGIFNLTDDKNNKESSKFKASLINGATFNVKRSDSTKGLYYMRRLAIFPGDWYHVVLTWEKSGKPRLFVNGLPYHVCFVPGQRCPLFFNADLDDIKQLVLSRSGDFTLDELKIYHRPLSNNEIYDEYRSIMPIDLVMERSIIDGEKGEAITLQAAPGGYYMRPYPVPGKPFVKADVNMKLELFDSEGKLLKTENKKLKIDKPMDIAMESMKLPVGNYKLVATINYDNKNFQRTFEVASFTEKVASDFSKTPYKLGKILFEKDFSNPKDKDVISEGISVKGSLNGTDYLEAGLKKRDRFSSIVSFPKKFIDKPVVLEISWPDDKTRNMAFYMYKESKGKQHRDRLQSGIQAGEEYPNGNQIESARYIFFPAREDYLFEARTLTPDQPAAISRIRVYEIPEKLPRLAIHYPENMKWRHFGHFDEDQTFTTNLRIDTKLTDKYPRKTLMMNEDFMRYFDYTGQNTIHYPTWRYTYGYNPLEGHIGNGMYPYKNGELAYIFDSFHRRNKKYIAMVNFATLPDIAELDKIQYDFEGKGMLAFDKFGNKATWAGKYKVANIANPEIRKMFINYFRDTVKRYANHPGFGGLEWWMNFGTWPSLDLGYGDYTVNAFTKATGIKVPKKSTKRYEFLTKEPVRSKWLKWRSEQVTTFIREMRAMLNEYNPTLKLNLAIRQNPEMYDKNGVDFTEIKKIKGITFVVVRHHNANRWMSHWGKPATTIYEELYDANAPMVKDYLVDGTVGGAIAASHYFESFNNSLMPKRFASYFQACDPKAHGRYFLKEPAFVVGAMDALDFVIGQQPFGTLGRDAETREFTQAYCALPAKPFKTVPGLKDPAIARYLNTKNGTYFYVVNMHHTPVKVKIDFSKKSFLGMGGVTYIDLSTDKKLSSDVIELLPFQLRSFLIPKEKVELIKSTLVDIPPTTEAFYQKRIVALKKAIKRLEENKIDVEKAKKDIALIEKALVAKQFAEAHRIAFSRRLNQIFQMEKDIKKLARRQKLIDQGIYRVNCGSTSFYEAPNGLFFFPDQKFDGLYGYVGSYNSIGRNISGIKNTDMPEIFRTESYDISCYKFKVPNGNYKAKLYIKCGYKPGFVKNGFEFSIKANDKMALYKFDVFTATKGDFNNVAIVEIKDIKVTDKILSLDFLFEKKTINNALGFQTGKRNGTCRLLNAIEIKKEKIEQ